MATVWMLDVDGVLNGSRAGWSRPPAVRDAYHLGIRYRLRFEPKLMQRIHRLAMSGQVEVRWSTTWNDAPGELTRTFPGVGPFEPAFGPRLPKFPHLTYDELKIKAALAVLAAGDRLIWTDDSVVPPARNRHIEFTRAEATGQALLIAPTASRGLRPDDMDAIEAFAQGDQPGTADDHRLYGMAREGRVFHLYSGPTSASGFIMAPSDCNRAWLTRVAVPADTNTGRLCRWCERGEKSSA